MSQVLANVLENAERLSPDDSVIRVAARTAPGSAATRVEIAVSDDGPGIARERAERVFEMFSQNGGGGRAGLGLAIAKAFVEAHGGLIWIDPDVARGARVVFTVPCEAARRRRRSERAMTKILVVDDDPSLLKALRIGLTARGDEVLTAHTGTEAVNQVALAGPDLVILDLGLPDVDGLEVCRRIREFSDVPIVVLSAYGDERRKVEALDSGADDFVTKPFGMAELEARLRVALRHGAARQREAAEHAHRRSTWATSTSTSSTTWRRWRARRCSSRRRSSSSWPTWPATPARSAPTT